VSGVPVPEGPGAALSEVCPLCRDVGWVLDGNTGRDPLTLEMIACPLPTCGHSGRRVTLVSLDPGFDTVARHPRTDEVMSIARSDRSLLR
jgi:hypothetical protein